MHMLQFHHGAVTNPIDLPSFQNPVRLCRYYISFLQEKKIMSATGSDNIHNFSSIYTYKWWKSERWIYHVEWTRSLPLTAAFHSDGFYRTPQHTHTPWAALHMTSFRQEMDRMNVMEVNCIHPTFPDSCTSFLCCSAKSPLLLIGTCMMCEEMDLCACRWWRTSPPPPAALPNSWAHVDPALSKLASSSGNR